MAQNRLERFDALLPEDVVCARFPGLIGSRELRTARQKGKIAFVSGKKGQIFYHPEAIAAYLSGKEVPCQNVSGPMENTGLEGRTAPQSSTHTGMTPEEEQRIAEALAQKYSAKRKNGSSNSQERQPAAHVLLSV